MITKKISFYGLGLTLLKGVLSLFNPATAQETDFETQTSGIGTITGCVTNCGGCNGFLDNFKK